MSALHISLQVRFCSSLLWSGSKIEPLKGHTNVMQLYRVKEASFAFVNFLEAFTVLLSNIYISLENKIIPLCSL